MAHEKLAWVCDKCGWLTVSDTKERHKMDSCRCKDGEVSGVDLEDGYCRFVGSPRLIARKFENKNWFALHENDGVKHGK